MAWELNSDRPIYAQIYEKILVRIVCSLYPAGSRLPSVRELAAEANVNPNTMQRAFAELEHSGLITTLRNNGRLVTEDLQMIENARSRLAQSQIDNFFANMRELGYNDGEIRTLVSSGVNHTEPVCNDDETRALESGGTKYEEDNAVRKEQGYRDERDE